MTEHHVFGSLSARQLRDAVAAGTYTARQVTEHYLSVIHQHTDLGAFMAVQDDAALARADELDHVYAATGVVGPLHGLPLAVKDTVNVAGMVTTFGSRLFADTEPQAEDDPISLNLNTAGAVQVGKTTVPEFALSSHSDNAISEPARNPRNPELTAGGSSGGAAAAVAAGMLPVAPGTDGGGSIRIPAAATGIVGLKPGRGTIPTDEQNDEVTNLGVTGPLARTVEDAALLMDALVDPTQTNGRYLTAAQQGRESACDVSIGYTTASPFQPDLDITLSQSAVQALTLAVTLLSKEGLSIEEMSFSYRPGYHKNFQTVWTQGLTRIPLPEGAEERMEALAKDFLQQARERTEAQYETAVAELSDWAADTRRQFEAYDIIVTPVLAFTPPPVGTFSAMAAQDDYEYQCKFTPYTSMINVMGLPAISIPVKDDEDGMSWSIQAIGRAGTEDKLLRLGARLEALVAANRPTTPAE
ncbi:amidase [Enteractinococcus coprophilus]|nr:amidase [Enteractinococcus coprophilus]